MRLTKNCFSFLCSWRTPPPSFFFSAGKIIFLHITIFVFRVLVTPLIYLYDYSVDALLEGLYQCQKVHQYAGVENVCSQSKYKKIEKIWDSPSQSIRGQIPNRKFPWFSMALYIGLNNLMKACPHIKGNRCSKEEYLLL